MKKLLYAFLIAAVAAVHSGCKDDEETFVHVEKVSIDVRELHLNPGKTYQLSVTIEPADATNRRIAWYSSNTNVATVDKSGLVTALAFGEVTLTAEANDMHVNDAIRLTIDDVDNSIPIESLTLDATSKTFDFAADPGVGASGSPRRSCRRTPRTKSSSGPPTIRSSPESTTTECWFPYRTAKRPSASRPPTAEIKPPGAK